MPIKPRHRGGRRGDRALARSAWSVRTGDPALAAATVNPTHFAACRSGPSNRILRDRIQRRLRRLRVGDRRALAPGVQPPAPHRTAEGQWSAQVRIDVNLAWNKSACRSLVSAWARRGEAIAPVRARPRPPWSLRLRRQGTGQARPLYASQRFRAARRETGGRPPVRIRRCSLHNIEAAHATTPVAPAGDASCPAKPPQDAVGLAASAPNPTDSRD